MLEANLTDTDGWSTHTACALGYDKGDLVYIIIYGPITTRTCYSHGAKAAWNTFIKMKIQYEADNPTTYLSHSSYLKLKESYQFFLDFEENQNQNENQH